MLVWCYPHSGIARERRAGRIACDHGGAVRWPSVSSALLLRKDKQLCVRVGARDADWAPRDLWLTRCARGLLGGVGRMSALAREESISPYQANVGLGGAIV
jgi:hypothetical protein